MPHIHHDIDMTCSALIVYEDQILVRLHEKYHKWLLPGGHIELHETPQEAVVREAKEEVGLDITLVTLPNYGQIPEDHCKNLVPPIFMNIHDIPGLPHRHQHCEMLFLARAQTGVLAPDAGEVATECRWLTSKQVQGMSELTEQMRYYLLSALTLLASK